MDRIQYRRDTLERWNAINPVLMDGEVALVATDSTKPNVYDSKKVGDGIHAFNDLEMLGYECLQELGNNTQFPVSQDTVTNNLSGEYFVGKDDIFSSRNYKLIPGNKYLIRLKIPDWPRENLSDSTIGSNLFLIENFVNNSKTTLSAVSTTNLNKQRCFIITVPEDSDYIIIGGRANNGYKVIYDINNITELNNSGVLYSKVFYGLNGDNTFTKAVKTEFVDVRGCNACSLIVPKSAKEGYIYKISYALTSSVEDLGQSYELQNMKGYITHVGWGEDVTNLVDLTKYNNVVGISFSLVEAKISDPLNPNELSPLQKEDFDYLIINKIVSSSLQELGDSTHLPVSQKVVNDNINELNSSLKSIGAYSFHGDNTKINTYLNVNGIKENNTYCIDIISNWNCTQGINKFSFIEYNDNESNELYVIKKEQDARSSFIFRAKDKSYKLFFKANAGEFAGCIIKNITDEIDNFSLNLLDYTKSIVLNDTQIRLYLNNSPFTKFNLINKSSVYKYRLMIGTSENYLDNRDFTHLGNFLNEGEYSLINSEEFIGKVAIVSVMRKDNQPYSLTQDVLNEIKKGCTFTNITNSNVNSISIEKLKDYHYYKFENIVAFSYTRIRAYNIGVDCSALRITNKSDLYEYGLLIGLGSVYPPTNFKDELVGFIKKGESAIIPIPSDKRNNVIVLNIRKKEDAHIDINEKIDIMNGVIVEKIYKTHKSKSIFKFANKGTTTYQGEKIQLSPNSYTWEKYMDIIPYVEPHFNQGGTTFGKYFFQLHTKGTPIAIYDLTTKQLVQEILEPTIDSHCNSISFGNKYFDETDPFPLLYVSDGDNINIYVVRFMVNDEGVYSANIVQTISTRPLEKLGFHVSNLAIDTVSNKMVLLGRPQIPWNISTSNDTLMCVVDIPNINATEIGEPLGEIYTFEYIYATQGQYASYGKLYLAFGNSATTSGVCVFDYNNGILLSKIDLGLCGGEPEGIGIYDNALFISWGENFITKHVF